MKYFYDTEFLEGTQTKRILGIPFSQSKPTIDLISIGIISEDDREYYAISKEFNLYEAWNRYDWKPDIDNGGMKKVYWIRENVLKPIWKELINIRGAKRIDYDGNSPDDYFSYSSLKYLVLKYGKTNKQIAEEIKQFTKCDCQKGIQQAYDHYDNNGICTNKIKFYGYYSAYDHVALCWLFGKMIDLPKGFPMYTIDLKQELDRIQVNANKLKEAQINYKYNSDLKKHPNYPKQTNEHNALADAKWNKELYKFLKSL